jgi:RimJ/RimL family protein N-acetyltransferase
MRVLLPFAFEDRGQRRVEAYVFAHNVASARVLEKCGFAREGVLREAVTDRDGIVMDCWVYGRLRG